MFQSIQKVADGVQPRQNAARMIQTNTLPKQPRQTPRWQRALATAFTRPDELLAYLGLPADMPRGPVGDFPMRVPRGFAARMTHGDASDPLLLQVWAQPEEALEVPGFVDDAVGDLAKQRPGGVIHKYDGRALLMTTGACAVHCRYCFRRHFPYGAALAARDHWQAALRELAADRSIREVILSGGDPLSLTDEKLGELTEGLEFLPHITRLRIHTRQPVVLPERVDEGLLAWLARGRLRKVMVIHTNHANELDDTVAEALARIRATGTVLLNQSVLLRNVNDRPEALVALSERLFACGVMPYYLHMLDRVRGTAHFEVPEETARALVAAAAARLPGYLVPRLAREVPGKPAKITLGA